MCYETHRKTINFSVSDMELENALWRYASSTALIQKILISQTPFKSAWKERELIKKTGYCGRFTKLLDLSGGTYRRMVVTKDSVLIAVKRG